MRRMSTYVVVGLALAVCACGSAQPSQVRAAVKSTRASSTVGATLSPSSTVSASSTHRPTPSGCRADQLVSRFGGRNGAGGHLINYVLLVNTSRLPCVLTGYPAVSGAEANGRTVLGTDGSFFPAPSTPVLVRPGDAATLGLESDSYCPNDPSGTGHPGELAKDFTITIPGSGVVRFAVPDAVELTCGLHLTAFFRLG